MIDLFAVQAGDALRCESLPDGPGVLRQLGSVFTRQHFCVLFHQVKPVAAPGDISVNLPVARHVDGDRNAGAKTGNVFDRDFAGWMQRGGDDSDGGFNAMDARADSAEMREGDDEPDGSMAAHADIADVVEEDHTGGAGGIDGIAEERADDYVRTARLIDDRCAEIIMQTLEAISAIGERPTAEIGSTIDDEAGRLSGGVRVEDGNAA